MLIYELKRRTRIKVLLAILIVGVFVVDAIFYDGQRTEAALPLSSLLKTLPFGGRIVLVNYCLNGIELFVSPPTPPEGGNFLIDYEDIPFIVYAYYQIYRPGPWVLGDYFPSIPPKIYYCHEPWGPHSVTGKVRQIGTSLY